MRYPLDKTGKLLEAGMTVRIPMGDGIWKIATIEEIQHRPSVMGDHWHVVAGGDSVDAIHAIASDCIKVG